MKITMGKCRGYKKVSGAHRLLKVYKKSKTKKIKIYLYIAKSCKFHERKSQRTLQSYSPSPRSAKQTTSESLVQMDTKKAFRRSERNCTLRCQHLRKDIQASQQKLCTHKKKN